MGISQTKEFIKKLEPIFKELLPDTGITFFIAPDLVSLGVVAPEILNHASNGRVVLAAQDCFWQDSGAYTGTISPKNLAELGVKIVEVGHAEQRRIFGETDEIVAKKIEALVSHGMTPLICIGEQRMGTEDEAIAECTAQLTIALSKTTLDVPIIIAYEPVWAIGKSQPAGADYVKKVVDGIRSTNLITSRLAKVQILYGGSAGPGLFDQLKPSVDGLFLGRFGHNPVNVVAVVSEMANRS